MKKLFSLVLALVLMSTMFVTANAASSETMSATMTMSNSFDNTLLEVKQQSTENGPVDIVITNADNTKDKEAFLRAEGAFLDNAAEQKVSSRTIDVNLYDYQKKDVKTSYVDAQLDSDVTYGIVTDLRVNGVSRVRWMGSTPVNCDKIKMEDTFTIDGVAVGFSFSSNGTWTVSNSVVTATATWTDNYTNKWSISHDYSNVDFNGYELYLKQKTTGYFTFSTNTYEISAVDSSLL